MADIIEPDGPWSARIIPRKDVWVIFTRDSDGVERRRASTMSSKDARLIVEKLNREASIPHDVPLEEGGSADG